MASDKTGKEGKENTPILHKKHEVKLTSLLLSCHYFYFCMDTFFINFFKSVIIHARKALGVTPVTILIRRDT